MATKSSANPLHFDRRVVDRFIRSGEIQREDYERHLAGLADVEAQSELIVTRLGEDEGALDDGDEDEGEG
jgi:hypothetical protein